MGAVFANSGSFQEKRYSSLNQHALWNCLSDSQKLGATGLSNFGYELVFVRKESADQIAIMLNGNSLATVNESGDIDTNPEINIR